MSLFIDRLTEMYQTELQALRRHGAHAEILDTTGGCAAILIDQPAGYMMLATNSWDGSLATTDNDRVHWYIGTYHDGEQISGHSGPDLEQLYITATRELSTIQPTPGPPPSAGNSA